jgi:hypothetical protein
VTPGAVECAASGTGCATPVGVFNPGDPMFNFPIAVQTSITAGLRYEVNDSAALKFEYAVVDVEDDPAELATTNNPLGVNYGLFNTDFTLAPPSDTVGIASIALDVIF